eukprot:29255-Pelagococcus_subviridis.AAC.6
MTVVITPRNGRGRGRGLRRRDFFRAKRKRQTRLLRRLLRERRRRRGRDRVGRPRALLPDRLGGRLRRSDGGVGGDRRDDRRRRRRRDRRLGDGRRLRRQRGRLHPGLRLRHRRGVLRGAAGHRGRRPRRRSSPRPSPGRRAGPRPGQPGRARDDGAAVADALGHAARLRHLRVVQRLGILRGALTARREPLRRALRGFLRGSRRVARFLRLALRRAAFFLLRFFARALRFPQLSLRPLLFLLRVDGVTAARGHRGRTAGVPHPRERRVDLFLAKFIPQRVLLVRAPVAPGDDMEQRRRGGGHLRAAAPRRSIERRQRPSQKMIPVRDHLVLSRHARRHRRRRRDVNVAVGVHGRGSREHLRGGLDVHHPRARVPQQRRFRGGAVLHLTPQHAVRERARGAGDAAVLHLDVERERGTGSSHRLASVLRRGVDRLLAPRERGGHPAAKARRVPQRLLRRGSRVGSRVAFDGDDARERRQARRDGSQRLQRRRRDAASARVRPPADAADVDVLRQPPRDGVQRALERVRLFQRRRAERAQSGRDERRHVVRVPVALEVVQHVDEQIDALARGGVVHHVVRGGFSRGDARQAERGDEPLVHERVRVVSKIRRRGEAGLRVASAFPVRPHHGRHREVRSLRVVARARAQRLGRVRADAAERLRVLDAVQQRVHRGRGPRLRARA